MQPASFVLSCICVLGAAACHRKAHAEVQRTPETPVAVKLATATSLPTPDVLALTGRITADQRADVTADTQGAVVVVMVERGQHVTRGQPLVELDVSSAALHTRETYAQLETARVEQQVADKECERSRALLVLGAISGAEADRQNARCSSASAQVGAAQARSASSRKLVRDGIVRAPFDGVVAARNVNTGEWVAPGRSLITLVDADPLKLELSVPESHIHAVQLGQPVELSTVARRDAVYRATITRIGAEVGGSRSLTVEATVEASTELVPGLFVEARVLVGHTLRPVLPASAVVYRGKTWHAFVVHDGVVEERIVQLGPSPGGGNVSILQSIAAGDRVVHTVTDQITDGLRVE